MSSFPKRKPEPGAAGKIRRPALAAGLVVLVFLTIGTFSYHALEDWNWIQCFYFCVVSLATVGYGDFAPTSDASRLFTSFYLLIGTGVVVAALGVIGSRYLEVRAERLARRREQKKAG